MKPGVMFKAVVVIALLVVAMPSVSHVQAAGAIIGGFYGGCVDFSVDVAVSGTKDDGSGLDRFMYEITDANGKKLYSETATRAVNLTLDSTVVDLSYDADGAVDGPPAKNPIKFQVIDLDSSNNQGAVLASATYDAPCLPASNQATRRDTFFIPKDVFGTITTSTPLYSGPNIGQLSLSTKVGAHHQVVYRNSDGTWVAIFVGGNDLVWIPVSAISVDISQLALPPTHIDGSSLVPSSSTSAVASLSTPTTGVSGRTLAVILRLRATPSSHAQILGLIKYGTKLAVLGRNKAGNYLKVEFNGMVGWVSAYYVRVTKIKGVNVPVVV